MAYLPSPSPAGAARCVRQVTYHVVFVLDEDAQLLEEGDDEDEEIVVVPFECVDELADDRLVAHLQLDFEIFGQVEE